jgi:hypothetical protein
MACVKPIRPVAACKNACASSAHSGCPTRLGHPGHDVADQGAGGRAVNLEVGGGKLHPCRLEGFEEPGEANRTSGQTVDAIDDHGLNLAETSEQLVQPRPVSPVVGDKSMSSKM